jgi:hypothetical protein
MLNPDDPEHQEIMHVLMYEAAALMKYFQEKKIPTPWAMSIFCALFGVVYEAGDIDLATIGQMNSTILDMAKFIKAKREEANKQKE